MESVSDGKVACASAVYRDAFRILLHVLGAALHHFHPCFARRVEQRSLQGGATHAQAAPVPKFGICETVAISVANATNLMAGRLHAEISQRSDRPRHESFATRLVDGPLAGLDYERVKTGSRGIQRGGKSGGSGARNDEVYVVHPSLAAGVGGSESAWANAAFSVLIRTVSKPALITVNASAVIHAVWTRGRAMPSITTAT